jgi:hypothetical protein
MSRYIEIDLEDYIGDIPTSVLVEELKQRKRFNGDDHNDLIKQIAKELGCEIKVSQVPVDFLQQIVGTILGVNKFYSEQELGKILFEFLNKKQ